MMEPGENPILLYDGVCGLCNRAVAFVLRHDRGDIRFAPLGGVYATEVTRTHPEIRGVDSIVFVTRGAHGVKVLTRSDAALAVAARTGFPHWMVWTAGRVPRFLRDAVYDLIARHRYRVFGRLPSCPVPPPGARERFLQ